jgi:hypothetical protein
VSWIYLPKGCENCPSSAEQGEGCSQASSLAGEPSATLSTTPTASESSKPESGMDCSMTPQSGTMLEHSTGVPGLDQWISSLRDSPVSHFPQQEIVSRKEMSATCGLIPFASLRRSGPNGAYWKMCQGCFPSLISDEYSSTWPRAGTTQDGIAYQLASLVPLIRDTASGLLPTPTATDWITAKHGLHSLTKRFSLKRSRALQVGPRLGEVLAAEFGWYQVPEISESLMGFPTGWTALESLEMLKFQRWLEQHGGSWEESDDLLVPR